MLVHPQFDPIAFQVGPVAVRWYGLMYLVGFVLFAVLGQYRARQNLLTGSRPRDVDDMLLYGVLGTMIRGVRAWIHLFHAVPSHPGPLRLFGGWVAERRAAGSP